MSEKWKRHPVIPYLLLSTQGNVKTEPHTVIETTKHFEAVINVPCHELQPTLENGRKVIKHLDEYYFLDRLIYETFHEKIPWGKRIHAINGDICDVRPENLEIAVKKVKERMPPKPRGGKNHWNYDPTIYTFYHEDKGIVERLTRSDFRAKYHLSSGCVSSMIRRSGGKSNGWTILEESN